MSDTMDMMDQAEGRMKECVDRARRGGASAAKATLHRGQQIRCTFESGRLKSADTLEDLWISVDVVRAGKRGRTSCNALDDLGAVLDRAMDIAQAGSDAHFDAYPAPTPAAGVKMASPEVAGISRQKLIDACEAALDPLRRYDDALFLEAQGGRGGAERLTVNSGGLCYRSANSHWGFGASVQRTRGTDMVWAGFGRDWRRLNEMFDPAQVSTPILEDLRRCEQTVPAPEGKVPAVLHDGMLSQFLWAFSMGINGRNVARGSSPLKGRLGERIFDPCLTVVDDPHLDWHPCACAMSEDGIATRPCTIIEGGVLKMFLYDLDTAGLAAAQPTGHNGCGPYSLDVAPGPTPSEELIASIRDGLYIKDLMGFGQSNIMNGDFSCNVALGFRIQDGKITGRVKNTMVAGNLYELLKRNVRLSSDKDPISRMPHAAIEGLSVSAAKDQA